MTNETAITKTQNTAAIIGQYCRKQCRQKAGKRQGGKQMFDRFASHLVLFYDCAPFDKKMHFPLSRKAVDFSRPRQVIFRNVLYTKLKRQREFALRLGVLLVIPVLGAFAATYQQELIKNTGCQLTDADFGW